MNIFETVKWYLYNANYKKQEWKPNKIFIPKKPRIEVPVDMNDTIAWKGIVWHHSATKDGLQAKDIPAVIKYHTSFRIDYEIAAAPQDIQDPQVKYVAFKGKWYKKDEYDSYYAKKSSGQGRVFQEPWRYAGYQIINEHESGKMNMYVARPFNTTGAHAAHMVNGKVNSYYNMNYIGICNIGNFDVEQITQDEWDYSLGIARYLMDKFGFASNEVIGHREVYVKLGIPVEKQCPGKNWNMDQFRKEL